MELHGMTVTLTTAGLPPKEQLDYWLQAIGEVFMALDVDVPENSPQGFEGRIVQHSQGCLALAEVLVEPHSVVRTASQCRQGDDEDFIALVQRTGETWIEQDGHEGWLREGEFTLLDSARAYTMRFPRPVHHEILKVPGNSLRAAVRGSERLTAIPVSGTSGPGRIFLAVLDSVHETVDSMESRAITGVSDALVDLLAASIGSLPSANARLPKNLELYHRERVRQFVQERLFDPDLSIDLIAAQVKLSARYVHRLFEDGPLTLSAWIWRERLETARRALLAADSATRSLTDIAYSVGFKDPAHFSRLFKATYGSSPRAFRAGLERH
jgi:AraC-like DNA-binding protein